MSSNQSTSKKVRIGVVGGGFGAEYQWHLDPDCEVVAVCELDENRRKHLIDVYGPAAEYRQYPEMLQHPGLNAVAVFTPPDVHAWMAIQAMEAGKHVISAVPAGMSEEELEWLLECVNRTGLKYMMAETSYFRGEIMACMEMAARSEFGTIFYSESEYHHEGLIGTMVDQYGKPTWRHGLPPMHYPTHCTGMIVPVTGERLTEVTAIGWGNDHEILKRNEYGNPFWCETAFFKTSGGHSARVQVGWHLAAGGTERGAFYGDLASFIMDRPEGSPSSTVRIAKDGQTIIKNGYPEGRVSIEPWQDPGYMKQLPKSMRVHTGHWDSHTFITHEFVGAIVEDRRPAVDVYEAIAYTLPGIVAHQSALRDGERMHIKDYGRATGP